MNNEFDRKWKKEAVAYYLGMCIEGLRKTTKPLRIASLRIDIRTRDLPNTKQDC
jgi:hypothetical protein